MNFIYSHFKGLVFFLLGIFFAILLSRNPFFQSFILHLGTFGYFGAFLAGMFFVSTLTVATAILLLIELTHYLPPIQMSLVAALGATVGNYIIFLFINRKVTHHIHSYFKKRKKKKTTHHFSSYTHWLLPFLGVLIIVSPFPDEIGVFLLSIFKMRTYQFLMLSFVLKCISIFLIVSSLHYLL